MDLKEHHQNTTDCRSLRTEILDLYGRDATDEVRQFEQMRLQLVRRKSDLTFLKRCRDAEVILVFARIEHRLRNKINNRIFHRASMALLRNEIRKARIKLDNLSRRLVKIHTALSS